MAEVKLALQYVVRYVF